MTIICRPIGTPLRTIVAEQGAVGHQISELGAAQPQRQIAAVDVDDQRRQG